MRNDLRYRFETTIIIHCRNNSAKPERECESQVMFQKERPSKGLLVLPRILNNVKELLAFEPYQV